MRYSSIILFILCLQSCSAKLQRETERQISTNSTVVDEVISTADSTLSNNSVDENIEFPLIGEFTLSNNEIFKNTNVLKKFIKESIGKKSNDSVDLRYNRSKICFIDEDTINLKIFNNVEADANGVDGGVNYLLIHIPVIRKLFIYCMDDFFITNSHLTLHIRVRDKISNENFYYNSSKHIFERSVVRTIDR